MVGRWWLLLGVCSSVFAQTAAMVRAAAHDFAAQAISPALTVEQRNEAAKLRQQAERDAQARPLRRDAAELRSYHGRHAPRPVGTGSGTGGFHRVARRARPARAEPAGGAFLGEALSGDPVGGGR